MRIETRDRNIARGHVLPASNRTATDWPGLNRMSVDVDVKVCLGSSVNESRVLRMRITCSKYVIEERFSAQRRNIC